jgi:hypothetical protein
MDFVYIENFSKTSVDNMELVQSALRETGAVVDTKLFPLIEEAENGNFLAQAEIQEMFTYGYNDVLPNYELAKRYIKKIQEANLESEDPIRIAEGLKAVAKMHYQFDEMWLASDAFMECFKYTVTNLEPNDWDSEVIKIVADNLDDYQDTEE